MQLKVGWGEFPLNRTSVAVDKFILQGLEAATFKMVSSKGQTQMEQLGDPVLAPVATE